MRVRSFETAQSERSWLFFCRVAEKCEAYLQSTEIPFTMMRAVLRRWLRNNSRRNARGCWCRGNNALFDYNATCPVAEVVLARAGRAVGCGAERSRSRVRIRGAPRQQGHCSRGAPSPRAFTVQKTPVPFPPFRVFGSQKIWISRVARMQSNCGWSTRTFFVETAENGSAN